MDSSYHQIELLDLSKLKTTEIVELLKSKGFEEGQVSEDHPEFLVHRDHHRKAKERLSEAEKAEIRKEIEMMIKHSRPVHPGNKGAGEGEEEIVIDL